ncbi:MAG: hypothetical protein ACJAYC_000228 [Halieaceae bacterium]|jgi:hypothetical protein
MAGDGHRAGEQGIVSQYDNNIAVISTGTVHIDADKLKILQVITGGDNTRSARFFCRPRNNPEALQSIDLGGRGTSLDSLDTKPGWQGIISEVGILFYEDGDRPASYSLIRLSPFTLAGQLKVLANEWLAIDRWSQKPAHFLTTNTQEKVTPLTTLIAIWMSLAWAWHGHGPGMGLAWAWAWHGHGPGMGLAWA